MNNQSDIKDAVDEYLDQLNFNESGDFTKKIVISVES